MEQMAKKEVDQLDETIALEGFGSEGVGGNPRELAKRLHVIAAKYRNEKERNKKIEVRLRQTISKVHKCVTPASTVIV